MNTSASFLMPPMAMTARPPMPSPTMAPAMQWAPPTNTFSPETAYASSPPSPWVSTGVPSSYVSTMSQPPWMTSSPAGVSAGRPDNGFSTGTITHTPVARVYGPSVTSASGTGRAGQWVFVPAGNPSEVSPSPSFTPQYEPPSATEYSPGLPPTVSSVSPYQTPPYPDAADPFNSASSAYGEPSAPTPRPVPMTPSSRRETVMTPLEEPSAVMRPTLKPAVKTSPKAVEAALPAANDPLGSLLSAESPQAPAPELTVQQQQVLTQLGNSFQEGLARYPRLIDQLERVGVDDFLRDPKSFMDQARSRVKGSRLLRFVLKRRLVENTIVSLFPVEYKYDARQFIRWLRGDANAINPFDEPKEEDVLGASLASRPLRSSSPLSGAPPHRHRKPHSLPAISA